MKNTTTAQIKRNWRLFDADQKIVGRLASEVAKILMGKDKPYYTPHLDCGDYVVITNASKVVFTGKKETQKMYYHYSGYPGGLKTKNAQKIRDLKSEDLLKHAVIGMLPKNKLAKLMVKKLFIFPLAENPYKDKFKSV